MPQISVKPYESIDGALRRFRRACDRAGVIKEVRRRKFHEKPSQARKNRLNAAVRRQEKLNAHENARKVRLY